MSTVAKVFVVLNLLLAVAFLGAAATLLGNADSYKTKLHDERTSSKMTLDEKDKALAEGTIRETNLTQLKNQADSKASLKSQEADQRKSQNEQLIQNINTLSAAYDSATKALQVAQTTIKDGRALVDQLQAERQALIGQKTAAEEERTAAVKNANAAELNLENAQQALQDAMAKLKNTQDELDRANFRWQSAVTQQPSLAGGIEQPAQQGKVLAADNEHGIYIISLGSEDGVKVGFKYTVSRGAHYVGQVVVNSVQAKMATCAAVPGLGTGPIQNNDDVRN